jgi:glucosamine-6-phosphate deaminase
LLKTACPAHNAAKEESEDPMPQRPEFEYTPSSAVPFRDRAACDRVRAITRETITNHPNPDLSIEVLPDADIAFMRIHDIFFRIKRSDDEDSRLVLILPQPHPQYRKVAWLINRFRVDCRNLYTFNMDEWADEDGKVAPETWPNGFMYAQLNNFYGLIDEDLRPPLDHIHGLNNRNIGSYGAMMEDLGGVDVCYGGIGWSGHIAFVDPGAPEFSGDLDEFVGMGARIVTLNPFTLAQSSLDPDFGMSGDWSWIPPKAATIGPKEVLSARLRSSWNSFTIDSTSVSWQRFSVRLALHGPVTPEVPASILQLGRTEAHLSESIAATIASAHDISWYA